MTPVFNTVPNKILQYMKFMTLVNLLQEIKSFVVTPISNPLWLKTRKRIMY